MKSELLNISDGNTYKHNDYAKVGCNDCRGCSDCCRDMGQSILLDPYDIYLLCQNLNTSFSQLIAEAKIELHSEEGLVLPNLKMVPHSLRKTDLPACAFLNKEGRCSIHSFRPGICRLFPLGRSYSPASLEYFVLKDACRACNGDKIRISRWLEYENMDEYESFLVHWHNLTKQVRSIVSDMPMENASAVMNGFIRLFYLMPYEDEFFKEYYRRSKEIM